MHYPYLLKFGYLLSGGNTNEPKIIGDLFKYLECECHTLAITIQTFIILDEIVKLEDIVKRNEDLVSIISVLQDVTRKMLGFR